LREFRWGGRRGRIFFEAAIARVEGTAIDEAATAEGPRRIWWPAVDVGAGELVTLAWESQWFPLFGWASGRYLDVEKGTARLVVVPARERLRVQDIVRGGRYVTVCTFAKGQAAGAAWQGESAKHVRTAVDRLAYGHQEMPEALGNLKVMIEEAR
jgi:hypothetical protein